jgi:hypothetical protein
LQFAQVFGEKRASFKNYAKNGGQNFEFFRIFSDFYLKVRVFFKFLSASDEFVQQELARICLFGVKEYRIQNTVDRMRNPSMANQIFSNSDPKMTMLFQVFIKSEEEKNRSRARIEKRPDFA